MLKTKDKDASSTTMTKPRLDLSGSCDFNGEATADIRDASGKSVDQIFFEFVFLSTPDSLQCWNMYQRFLINIDRYDYDPRKVIDCVANLNSLRKTNRMPTKDG